MTEVCGPQAQEDIQRVLRKVQCAGSSVSATRRVPNSSQNASSFLDYSARVVVHYHSHHRRSEMQVLRSHSSASPNIQLESGLKHLNSGVYACNPVRFELLWSLSLGQNKEVK